MATDRRRRRAYLGTAEAGMLRSDDGGVTWRPVGDGIREDHVSAVAVGHWGDRSTGGGTLWAGTEPSALYRSEDGGDSWRRLPGLLDLPSASTWSFPPARSAREAHTAEEAESWIYRRTDGGPWEPVREGLPDPEGTTISSLTVVPGLPGLLYAANNRGVFRSRDAGATWAGLAVGWPRRYRRQRVVGLAVLRGGRTAGA